MSTDPIQPHILFRLLLAKTLYTNANQACDTTVDVYSFSRGLITLHDAIDNFLGAIAAHLNIPPKQDSTLLVVMNTICEHEVQRDPGFVLSSRNEIVQLNTIRNNIKHHGLTPDIARSKALIQPVTSFFKAYALKYFSLEWEMISIADLVTDMSCRQALKIVEALISTGNFKDALNQMAIIKFQVFEERLLRIALDAGFDFYPPTEKVKQLRVSKNIFAKEARSDVFTLLWDRAGYLEKGIDQNAMKLFENLTAVVGIRSASDWTYIIRHNNNWCEANWSRDVALFCFDFLVDAIIKAQGPQYPVRQQMMSVKHRIEAIADFNLYGKEHSVIFTLRSGEQCDAILFSFIDGKWEIFEPKDCLMVILVSRSDGEVLEPLWGSFDEKDIHNVKVVRTELYTQDESGNRVLVSSVK